jgi:hypothetical protein
MLDFTRTVLARIVAAFRLIGRGDHWLEHSWQQRKWRDFMVAWATITAVVMLIALLLPFVMYLVPAALYNVPASVLGRKLATLSVIEVWDFASRLSMLIGTVAVVLTVPAMALREFFGDLEHHLAKP